MTPSKAKEPPEPRDTSLNVLQRLHAVMADLGYVQKTGRTAKEAGGYTFVKHDEVTAAVRPLFVEHGIVSLPTVVDHHRDGNQTTLVVDVTFVNIDLPTDFVTVRAVGYGIDKQDKGPGKAMSYAVKYALLKTLSLETGDDPEVDEVERDVQVQPHQQRPAAPAPAPREGGANGHSPGRPALAKFWTVARGQQVPEEAVRQWFTRNLGVDSTKDATDAQLAEATMWAQSISALQARLYEAAQPFGGMDPRTSVAEAQRMFPSMAEGNYGLGALTLPEWEQFIGWAQAKSNAYLDAQSAQEHGATTDPNEPPF
jgi:hypothetical protein